MTARHSKQRHAYGYVPDAPDSRDQLLHFTVGSMSDLPRKVDLRESGFLPPIWDQGSIGSCTAHGTAAALLYAAAHAQTVVPMISRLQLYYDARKLEGTTAEDAGAQIRDAIKAASLGVAPETDWPYDVANFAVEPPAQAVNDANNNAISYSRLPATLPHIMTNLAEGFPIVDGMPVYESMEAEQARSTGQVPMPQIGEQLLGYHCTLTIGYDLDADDGYGGTGVLIKRNSWGTGYGMDGYFTLPVAYRAQLSDPWCIEVAD